MFLRDICPRGPRGICPTSINTYYIFTKISNETILNYPRDICPGCVYLVFFLLILFLGTTGFSIMTAKDDEFIAQAREQPLSWSSCLMSIKSINFDI